MSSLWRVLFRRESPPHPEMAGEWRGRPARTHWPAGRRPHPPPYPGEEDRSCENAIAPHGDLGAAYGRNHTVAQASSL